MFPHYLLSPFLFKQVVVVCIFDPVSIQLAIDFANSPKILKCGHEVDVPMTTESLLGKLSAESLGYVRFTLER